MSDADASQTRLFNRTTQPRVLEWGSGVVMPGESFLTDHPETFAPDTPNSAWTVDAEAASQLPPNPAVTNPPASTPDGLSEPAGGLTGANSGAPGTAETVMVEPNGEIRNEAGAVVGYVNTAAEAAANPQE